MDQEVKTTTKFLNRLGRRRDKGPRVPEEEDTLLQGVQVQILSQEGNEKPKEEVNLMIEGSADQEEDQRTTGG